jgi:hypothetical protein
LLVVLGRWDDAEPIGTGLVSAQADLDALSVAPFLAQIAAARGDDATLQRCVLVAGDRRDSSYVDQRVGATLALAREAIDRGCPEEALRMAKGVLALETTYGQFRTEAYSLSIETAIVLGDEPSISELETFAARLEPAQATPLLRAGQARVAAEQAHRRGDDAAAVGFEDEAISLLRSVGARPMQANALLERARRRQDPEALAEARSIYTDLGATRWLARVDRATEVVA